MKVVLSGATGYIGREVLSQCLGHPSITTLIVLSRRPIENLNDPKAKVLIVSDFTAYDSAAVAEFKSADAAIWCLGTSTGDEKVDIEFPLAFIKLIKETETPFRYVQLSGAFTELPPSKPDQPERSLWFFAQGRRVRGRMEAAVPQEQNQNLTVYMLKPGGVLPKTKGWLSTYVFGDSLSVRIDYLGATLVDLAVNGGEQKLWTNKEITARGKELLESSN